MLLRFISNWCNLKQMELRRQRDLIEGGAGGGEGASGVGQDPVHPLSHPAGVIYVYHIYLIALWLNR